MTATLRTIRAATAFGRLQLGALAAAAGLIMAPVARGLAGAERLSWPMGVGVWMALAAGAFLVLVALRMGLRRVSEALQARSEPFRYWLLVRALVVRDLRARYARSALGWPWILIQPLLQMLVFVALRAIIGLSDAGGMNLALFLLAAILPWNMIVTTVTSSAPAILGNAALLKKLPVPRETFVLAAAVTALADFLAGFAILLVLMTVVGANVSWSLLWLPVLVAIALVMATAVALLVAAVAPFRSDLRLAVPFLMQVWFFLTPVFYSLEAVAPRLRTLLSLNPSVGLIGGFRNVLGTGTPPELGALAWSLGFSLLLLAVSWPFFRHMSRYFADMM